MNNIIADIRRTIVVTIIAAVVLCGIYPLVVWGLGQTLFHYQANGSLITDKDGTVLGSEMIGQNFSDDQYFNLTPLGRGHRLRRHQLRRHQSRPHLAEAP